MHNTPHISPEDAANLVEQGAFVVCLDVAPGTEFGMDYEVFATAENFRGVKMIPPGLHFVVYRQAGYSEFRRGFFCNLERGQVLLRKWNVQQEDFEFSSSLEQEMRPIQDYLRGGADSETYDRLQKAVHRMEFDRFMAPYPLEYYGIWRSLSNFVTSSVLNRCGITLGTPIFPGDIDVSLPAADSLSSQDAGLVPYFDDLPRTAVFTDWSEKNLHSRVKLQTQGSKENGSLAMLSASEISQMYLDRSGEVEEKLSTLYGNSYEALLGELQLSFILFLLLASLPALDQWKHMVHVLCHCDAAVTKHPKLYEKFLSVLHIQLQQAGEDLFDDELSQDNFLRESFSSLFDILDFSYSVESATESVAQVDSSLRKTAREFGKFLADRFSLNVNGELAVFTGRGDLANAPTIVTLEELETGTGSLHIGETSTLRLPAANLQATKVVQKSSNIDCCNAPRHTFEDGENALNLLVAQGIVGISVKGKEN